MSMRLIVRLIRSLFFFTMNIVTGATYTPERFIVWKIWYIVLEVGGPCSCYKCKNEAEIGLNKQYKQVINTTNL